MIFGEILSELGMQFLPIKKGAHIFEQGHAIENIYFIKSGRVKLSRDTIDGVPVILHVGFKGEAIAEASLFSEQYHCSAIADSKGELAFVKKAELLRLLEDKPELLLKLLAIFSRQVRDLRAINEIKNIRSAKERVLSFIRCEMNEAKELSLELSLKDMAYKIGLAHETFYRELKALESSGIIQRNAHQITLR